MREVREPAEVTLGRAAVGVRFVVERVGDARPPADEREDGLVAALAAEGIVAGTVLTPERRLPLGGPVVVRLGRARLALGRDVARRLVLMPVGADAHGRDGRDDGEGR